MDIDSRAQSRSELKVLVGYERDTMEAEEISESCHKRVKLSDNESIRPPEAEAGIGRHITVPPDVNTDSQALDLNVDVGPISVMSGVDGPECIQESNELLTFAKEGKNGGFYLDLNAEDMSSSIKNDPFYPSKNFERVKSRDDSECGSSMDENDSLRVWKGLKENNYMSAPRGLVPMPIPKTRGRKKHNDVMKKKIELARKEQVDRFAKVAAPSGLLNGLNPGIINHVRNSKQVHSIIEALVRSEKTENKRGRGEHTEREGPLNIHGSRMNRSELRSGDVLLERRHKRDFSLFAKSNNLSLGATRGDHGSQCNIIDKDDELALKLSSSQTVASEITSCLSNEESGNLTSVTSLSVKAANAASQWLELLNQDIRGRLAALRRSKKRVRAVITTELPLLISNEFSSNLEKDLNVRKSSTLCHPDKASADAHAVRWSTLFGQMDKSLSDEESNLENWLNQVNEMQLLCERGLSNSLYTASQGIDLMGNDSRLGEAHNPENDLAVRAAAASIYSACNFLLTIGNQPCC